MATKVGSLIISLALESGAFKSGLDKSTAELRKAEKQIRQVGQNMADLGKGLSLAVTVPMIAIGKKAIDGFVAQEKAMADVKAALQSMGDVSGKTAAELARTADALEMRSLFDAEVILKQVSAQLLTFGNVAGEQFDRAQQAAIDMATRLGGEPQAAAIALGKALNDPVKGITALTRVGVQFTEAQKAQIKAMTEAGNVAGAQGVILGEVERQFKGAAAAAADASPWRQAQVAIGQAMDQIGAAILPMIKPVTEAIVTIAQAFNSLSPAMQQFVVIAGIAAAALGPMLIALGALVSLGAPLLAALGAAGTAVSVLATGFQLAGVVIAAAGRALLALVATNPVLAALAAAATAVYLAWQNWDKIKAVLGSIGSAIASWWNGTVRPVLAAVGSAVMGALKWWIDLQVGALRAVQALTTGVREWLQTRMAAVWEWVLGKIGQVKKAFFDLYDAVVGNSYIPDMVDGIAREMKRLDTVMVGQANKATGKTSEAFRKLAQDVAPILDRLFPEAAAQRDFSNEVATIEAAGAAGAISPDTQRAALEALRDEFSASLPKAPSIISEQGDDLQAVLAGINDQVRAMGPVIDSAKVKWDGFSEAIRERGGEAFNALTHHIEGVLLGMESLGDAVRSLISQLASMALQEFVFKPLGQSLGIPGFASGTNYAPGGMALVGERGPEIVNLPRGSQVIPNGETNRMLRERTVTYSPTFVFPGITNAREAREAGGQAARRHRAELNGPLRRN